MSCDVSRYRHEPDKKMGNPNVFEIIANSLQMKNNDKRND